MEVGEIITELMESEKDGSLLIFRKLITFGSTPRCGSEQGDPQGRTKWQPVFKSLLKILANNRDFGKERILLIPHAFIVLLYKEYGVDELKIILQSYLQLDNSRLCSFDTEYHIEDIDLFKLLISHGYLQVNKREIYTGRVCELPFEVLYRNCTRYTKYTYLAYKVLHTWLQRTSETDFWDTCDPLLERKLETIIYSNWDNSIKEVSKQNSTSIFNQYLRIMNRKYQEFLRFALQDCIENISWLNETKYVILTEIFKVWDNIEAIVDLKFILNIFTSLTRNYLRTSGTKLYNAISNKLSEQQWKSTFEEPIDIIINDWAKSGTQNHQAIQLLCTQWLEPTIRKHHSILPLLWDLSKQKDYLFRSHMERIASQIGFDLPGRSVYDLTSHMNSRDEDRRINSFAAHSQKQICLKNDNLEEHFSIVKQFLIYNASSNSTYIRRGVIKYFKIFFLNLLKSCNSEEFYDEKVLTIFNWMHDFLLDGFEIGSCYQRKVLAIKLYEIILFYTNERKISDELKNDPRYRDDLKNGFKAKTKLLDLGEWMFTNKNTLLWLLKLILDPATDVREVSEAIIIEHFHKNSLNESEKKVLLETAIAKCNSSKFYEAESGATLLKILSVWLPFEEITTIKDINLESKQTSRFCKSPKPHTQYIEYLLHEADNQLMDVKADILRAAMQNSPFHGTLTAILNVGFRNEYQTESITVEFTEKLLTLLEIAVEYLLSLLSSKSKDCEFSSSFAEMGLAINKTVKESEISDEYDDIVLSPAHQVVITCIWISLKVSCELASEIGMLIQSQKMVERSSNLITSVLTKCRHKGAIEAAGLAIGHLTRKLVNTEGYNKLPEEWLRSLTSGDDRNPNLTRRSAGLSIMFHRIVGNDNRHGKPLVHIAIRDLLYLLENNTEERNESYQDLPRAKYLHFLQRLVEDSDLHAQVVPYLERITMECFRNLQSEIWTVRNASLQLFGAIVPRIAGQQNGGQTLDYGNGYSTDHFISHYPALADHIYSELTVAASSDSTLKIHSAIVPSLVLLSRMSTGGSDFIDYSSKLYVHEVKRNLKLLFGSPIGNVRILAAKAYAALVPFPQISAEGIALQETLKQAAHSNQAHGYLCAIKYVGDKFRSDNEIAYSNLDNLNEFLFQDYEKDSMTRISSVESFWRNLDSSETKFNPCYVVEALSLSVFNDKWHQIYLFNEIGEEKDRILDTQRSKPGFCEYVDTLTRIYVDYVNRIYKLSSRHRFHPHLNFDEGIIRRILNSQCVDQAVTFLDNLDPVKPVVHRFIFNYILDKFPNCEEALLDAITRYLSKSMKGDNPVFPRSVLGSRRVQRDEIKSKVYRVIDMINGDGKYLKFELFLYQMLRKYVWDNRSFSAMMSYCSANVLDADEVVRETVTNCLPWILYLYGCINEHENKRNILRLCLALLKDESMEIRESARVSMANISFSNLVEILHEKILGVIVDHKSYFSFTTALQMVQFFSDYAASLNIGKDSKAIVESPFDHEEDTTSLEETKIFNIIFDRISAMRQIDLRYNDSELGDIVCDDAIEAKYVIQKKTGLNFSDLKTILDLRYPDYMVAKREIIFESCNRIQKVIEYNESDEGKMKLLLSEFPVLALLK